MKAIAPNGLEVDRTLETILGTCGIDFWQSGIGG